MVVKYGEWVDQLIYQLITMNRAITTAKITGGIFRRAVSYNFCIGWAPLDPRKHTTMSHNTNNYYLDLWEYGHYPDWVHLNSIPARTYEPQVVNTIVATLNSRYNTKITPEFLLSHTARPWAKFLSKDLKLNAQFHDVYPVLLGKLSTSIFVKESRLTWVQEQKARFEYTLSSFDAEIPETVGEFLQRYNEDIESCVLASNFGFAAEIDQAESALQKHEYDQNMNAAPGVQELKNLAPENDNIFNRLLAFLH